jgi:hypothetical protein
VNRPSASRLPALVALVAALAFALLPALASGKAHDNRGHHDNGHHQAKHHGHHGKGNIRDHHGKGHGRGKEVRVMTRNLYLGADLGPAIGTESLQELAEANGAILNQVTSNSFPTRAKGLASEILEKRPDLVGLQEVALWRTAPPSIAPLQTGPSATTVRYDYLQELLDQLNAGKGPAPYRVVVVQQEFDLEAPADENGEPGDGPPAQGIPDAEINGRLTMRDVILARSSGGVHTWNSRGANFETLLAVPILGQPLTIARGWTSTDARVRGSHPFHFVNTHLEAFQPEVRAAQAGELVAPGGPATSDLPVVLVGDLNSDDDTVSGADTLAYSVLLKAGLVERSTADPLSCCIDSPLLAVGAGGSVADFDHQVDHVMTRDPDEVTLDSSSVTGLQPVNGFWNSDHAGLFSALRFAN